MQADGVVLKGESDTWPGLEFAEATVRLGKNMEKGPLLRSEEGGDGVSSWCKSEEMFLKRSRYSNFVSGWPEHSQRNEPREGAGCGPESRTTLGLQRGNKRENSSS